MHSLLISIIPFISIPSSHVFCTSNTCHFCFIPSVLFPPVGESRECIGALSCLFGLVLVLNMCCFELVSGTERDSAALLTLEQQLRRASGLLQKGIGSLPPSQVPQKPRAPRTEKFCKLNLWIHVYEGKNLPCAMQKQDINIQGNFLFKKSSWYLTVWNRSSFTGVFFRKGILTAEREEVGSVTPPAPPGNKRTKGRWV